MKVCFFGTYEKNYSSNRIIIKGLRKNNIDITECHEPLWEKYRNKSGKFLKIFSLLKLGFGMVWAYLMLFFRFQKNCKKNDVVIVGYIGQLDIIFLKLILFLRKKKPKVILAPLVSLYDTAIIDRGLSGRNNLFAKLLYRLDKVSFQLADVVVFDTKEHINYIRDLFKLDRDKFKRVWVGADEEVFYPLTIKAFKQDSHLEFISGSSSEISLTSSKFSKPSLADNNFQVLFIGKYIPLHGLEYIIKASKLLENEKDIKFKMVGSGQLYHKIRRLSDKLEIKNIDFIKWIEYNDLVNEINKADTVLGIFGGTDKSLRVIPNKVFQAVACKKAVITGDSPAIRELFEDGENIMLCENRNAEALKNAILKLKSNEKLREKIAENGYFLFQDGLDANSSGKSMAKIIANFRWNN
ncbi:glycosyltransferase [Patescibacteria group bacterium]|nr:glycosyltransferase [Patescibacteria group bacterium]